MIVLFLLYTWCLLTVMVEAFAPLPPLRLSRWVSPRFLYNNSLRNTKMKQNPSYYDILGASYRDTKEQLKMKYKQAAKRTHPDATKFSGQFTSNHDFREVNMAYQVLSNDQERYKYDKSLGLYDPIVGGCPYDALDSYQAVSRDFTSSMYYA